VQINRNRENRSRGVEREGKRERKDVARVNRRNVESYH